MENTYLPCWEIPPVSGDPSRIGRSLACRDPLPLRGAGSLHARDLPLRSGSPSTVVISLHGRYVFFHTSLASLKYYPNSSSLVVIHVLFAFPQHHSPPPLSHESTTETHVYSIRHVLYQTIFSSHWSFFWLFRSKFTPESSKAF